MKRLIVAATRAELSGICDFLDLPEKEFIESLGFDLLITGVGMTATAFALGRHLSDHYDLVINMGIAGCYDRNTPLGTVLNVISDEFSELGAEDKDEFLSIDLLGFGKSRYLAADNTESSTVSNLRKVNGITVNKVHGNTKSIAAIVARLDPITESMEGAAVFYCCNKLNIPCIQIRSISNYVEERNRDAWKIGLAIKNLNDWLLDFLTNG